MKLFKISNPKGSYEDVIEMVVCEASIEDLKNRLVYHKVGDYTTITGFNEYRNNGYVFWDRHPEDLIIEEIELNEPKVICTDVWEG